MENGQLKHYTGTVYHILILPALVGVIAGFLAIGFRYLLFFFQNLFFFQEISGSEVPPVMHDLGWMVIFIPAVGGILVGLITHYIASEVKGHGVPEVMEAVAVKGGFLRAKSILFKALGSALSIGSGGSVGREGPIIQMGSGAGSTVGQLLRLPKSNIKILVGCGAAGGIAATFNTPVAAVIFALEIILREFKSYSFISLVISAFFGTIISRVFLGSHAAFQVPDYAFVSLYEIPLYLLLGVLAGLTAYLTINMVYKTEGYFHKISIPDYWKPALGGLLVGIVGYFYPQVFGYGYSTIDQLLNQEIVLQLCIVLFVFKIIVFAVTIGSGASGGVFSPSLFIGASLGSICGWIFNAYFPEITAPVGAYALVGMAAVFAAASHATFTAIIIIFEMTLDYNIILPLMFACVLADLMVRFISEDTIYTKKLRLRGITISQDMETNRMDTLEVRTSMRPPSGFTIHHSVSEVHTYILHHAIDEIDISDEAGILRGIITHKDIDKIPNNQMNQNVKAWMRKNVRVTYPYETLSDALSKMAHSNIETLPVVAGEIDYTLKGIITRDDIIHMLGSENEQ